MSFETILMVDWSGGNDRGATPKKDAIWVCVARGGTAEPAQYMRNRQVAEAWITDFLEAENAAGRRVMAGFDFAFGYPAGFGRALTGSDDPFAVWDWFAARVKDAPNANNRFDLAGEINALFPGTGPYWGNGLKRDIPHLPRKGRVREGHGMPEKRKAEEQAKGAFPVWQLSGAGAVGSQVIMGLPMLSRLRTRFGRDLSVWPFEPSDRQIAIVEVWPSLIAKTITDTLPTGRIKDAHQVTVLAEALSGMSADDLARLLTAKPNPEGSILGLGDEALLERAAQARLAPPALKNDCFAMPQGAYWTPVDDALAHLKKNLSCVTGKETCALADAAGRFLAEDVTAVRAHPPAPNAAVDGYGFAGPAPEGLNNLPLVDGRAAAGSPFRGAVPPGQAIRILTGANLPEGVDTVVLQEDVSVAHQTLRFRGPLKQGANARKSGEDMQRGDVILQRGRKPRSADLGMMAAAGVGHVTVRKPLRVGILSTGDELRDPGSTADVGHIFDANRPMLLTEVASWGHQVIDLDRAPDDRAVLRGRLDEAATRCDVIVASGGASAGDEDHMSALLHGTGSFALWRIAMKPGRPLAMGLWGGVPVLGLPGNPVAAMVCALIFAAPALSVMAGGGWTTPARYMLPAGFAKSKRAGRREYLRARVEGGQVRVFPSEGSGRVSGLSWASGLVELGDDAMTIAPGDPVPFLPFAGWRA